MKNINSFCWYLLLLFLPLLISSNYSIAQTKDEVATRFVTDVSGTGTSAAAFLEIGVGARATAMGGAYTSIATDV